MPNQLSGSAFSDLGLGTMLGQQTATETEEERRRRKLGMSALSPGGAADQLFSYGRTGIAPMAGMSGVGR